MLESKMTMSAGANPFAPKSMGKNPDQMSDFHGTLPSSAPLANPYIPFQQENPVKYEAAKGLIRGTLFPGLDLPYLGMVNTKEKGHSDLAELQALAFAMNELALYLDTHRNDSDAAELFQSYSELYRDGVCEYQKRHGILYQAFAAQDGTYCWPNGPWPWEYAANLHMED